MTGWRQQLWQYGPTCGSAVVLCVIVVSLVNCNTMTCEAEILKPDSPMSCPERACSRVKPLLSTISESAMPGNNIGGKTLLATCMTLMALLFLPYVRAMDTILRGACPEAAAGTGDNVKVCPLGCFTEPAGVVFQRMRSFGYCGCLFLALTALVGVQDEKGVHALFAFIFFLCCGLYLMMTNAVLGDICTAARSAAQERGSSGTAAVKAGENYDWLQKSLRWKRWATIVYWAFFLFLPWTGYLACRLAMAPGDTRVQVIVNMFSISQWVAVLALLTWTSSLNAELAHAPQLQQRATKSADNAVVVQQTDLSAALA